MEPVRTALAPAKVNLFLHVGPARADGRHDLDSLVVFSDARITDILQLVPSEAFVLTVIGSTAHASGSIDENLVSRAVRALEETSARQLKHHIELEKRLPVAAGIGGGSADAGAALRMLASQSGLSEEVLLSIAAALGGDVPAAFINKPVLMRGDGDEVTPVQDLPALPAILVNCGAPCPTGPVFRHFDEMRGGSGFAEVDLPVFANADMLMEWLSAETRNDLEAPARALVPQISGTLDAMKALDGTRLVRMSGSGATCFALFSSEAEAVSAALALSDDHPDWWIQPTVLGIGAS